MVSRICMWGSVAGVSALAMVSLAGCQSGDPFSPSGIVFFNATELQVGSGVQALTGTVATVTYMGWQYDESEADSKGPQFETGRNETFVVGVSQQLDAQVSGVIAGLDRGSVGMRVGGLRRVVIPPELALGSNSIPANAAVVLDVQLIDVQPLTTDSAPFSITDLRVGTGEVIANGTTASLNFGGWLYDTSQPDNKGFVFDVGGFSLTVGTGQVLQGFDEGLVGMRVGGERRLVLPPDKAYGSGTPSLLIPPNATLVFDVTLLSVP